MAHYNHSFPAEGIPGIWLNVFEKLDKADKPAFSRTCDQWHDWVAPKISIFLSKEFAPSLVEALPKKAFLKSRELCQSWTQELDHQSQMHPSYHRFHFEIGAKRHRRPKLHIEFSSAGEIQKFMREMESHPGNPFPRRAILLDFKFSQDPSLGKMERVDLGKAFWLNAIKLLEKFGEHIWDATFRIFDSGIIGYILMEHFRDCLLLLPHLKRLKIVADIAARPWFIPDYYEQHSLPQLVQLKTVVIESNHEFIGIVLNSCCVAANITRLCYSVNSRASVNYELVNKFVNLEVLKAELFIEDLEEFRNLPQIPPLREFWLEFNNRAVCAPRLFNALQPFANSLVNFQLFDTLIVRDEDRTRTIINLPNLKRLSVSQWKGSLDPIIQISTLSILKIFSSRIPISQSEGNQLEFYGFKDRIYESNIWNLLSSLNTFYVKGKFHHRYFFDKRQLTAQCESGSVNNTKGTVDKYSQTNDYVRNMDTKSNDDTDIEEDDSD